MDELYFESGYVEAKYFVYVANATAGFTPYIAEGYLPSDFFEDRGAFAAIFCDAEIVVGMLLEAQAFLSGTFSINIGVQRFRNTSIALTSSFTQTAIGTRGQDTDLFAFTNAAIAVEVSRIRTTNITASSVFNIATDFVVKRSADADVDAVFSAIINGLRSRDFNLETQAAFSFVCSVETTKVFASTISSQSAISLTPSVFRNVAIAATSTATVSVSGDRTRSSAVSLNAEFTVSPTARQIRDAHLTGTGVATIVCLAVKTAQVSSIQQAQFTQISLAGILENGNALLAVYASVFVSRKAGRFSDRPRDLVDNFVSGLPSFDSSIKKFGTHSVSGGNNANSNSISGNRYQTPIPSQAQDFYLEVWHYATANANGTFGGMINFFQFQTTTNGTRYRFQPYVGSPSGGVFSNLYRYTHTSDITLNQWNHLAVVKLGNTIAYYINGTRVYFYGYPTTTSDPAEAVPFYPWGNAALNGTPVSFNASNGARIDEAIYVLGSAYGYNTADTTIAVPTAARTNGDNVAYLYHFDNDVLDDIRLLQTANSAIQSQVTVSAAIGYVATYQANISASSSVTAVIGKINEINLVAFTNAAITANVNVFRGYNADFLASASVSVTAVRIKQNTADVSSNAVLASTPNRLRDTAVTISGAATVTVTGNVQRSGSADITANALVTAIIGTLEDINLVAFSNAAVNTLAVKTVFAQSALAIAFTQLSTAVKTGNGVSAITSANSLTALNDRFRNAGATLSALGSTVTVANEIQGIGANLSSRFYTAHIYIDDDYLASGYYEQFETNAVKTANGAAAFESTAALTVSITTDVFAALVATSQASVNATVVKTVSANIAQSSAFAITAVGVKTARGIASTVAVFTVFCNAVTAGEINMVAFTNASISVTANSTKPGNAVLTAQASVFAYTQDSLNSVGEADISSQFSINIVAVKTVNAVIVTEAVASSLSVVVKTVAVEIPLDCNFTQTVTALRIKQISSSQSALVTVSATAVKTSTAQSTITAQSTLSVSARKSVNAVIVTQAVASTLTANIRIAGLFIDATVVSTVTVSGSVTRRAVSTITSAATVSITTVKLVSVVAAITSSGGVSATVNARKVFAAAITSALTFVVAVRELRLDAIVYVIPAEGWTYRIEGETRLHTILSESRQKQIVRESRLHTINGESRIHII